MLNDRLSILVWSRLNIGVMCITFARWAGWTMVNRNFVSFAMYLDLFVAIAIASHYTVCNTPKHIDLACLSK